MKKLKARLGDWNSTRTRVRLVLLIPMLFGCPSRLWSSAIPPKASGCQTPLIKAIRWRQTDEIHRLIKSGVNLNERVCPEGNTALFEALGSQPEVAKELILAGADPNEADGAGSSPLMSAAFHCLEDIASLLLSKGAHINASNSHGSTPLMEAASQCMDGKMVALLLRSGASINGKDSWGETALTTGAFYGNESAVMELVAAGADINAKTNAGETALSIAQERSVGRKPSHDRIADFLKTFSDAKVSQP
jgi:ankyrin repeat protein